MLWVVFRQRSFTERSLCSLNHRVSVYQWGREGWTEVCSSGEAEAALEDLLGYVRG